MHIGKKMKVTSLLTFIVLLTAVSFNAMALWIKSEEGYDCRITCSEAGWVTPTTGKYKDTNRNFYICMTNINEEGQKTGYSLSHEPGCNVVHNGAAVNARDFSCMCG